MVNIEGKEGYKIVTSRKVRLVCEYNGEILAYGTVRRYQEFIFLELPGKYPETMTPSEYLRWLHENPHWKVQEGTAR